MRHRKVYVIYVRISSGFGFLFVRNYRRTIIFPGFLPPRKPKEKAFRFFALGPVLPPTPWAGGTDVESSLYCLFDLRPVGPAPRTVSLWATCRLRVSRLRILFGCLEFASSRHILPP